MSAATEERKAARKAADTARKAAQANQRKKPMTFLARSKPYNTTPAGKHMCARCGITKNQHSGRSAYCIDCKRFAPKEHE